MVCVPGACSECGADLGGAARDRRCRGSRYSTSPRPRRRGHRVPGAGPGLRAVRRRSPPGRPAGRDRAGRSTGRKCTRQAANLACAHHLPVGRAARLMGDMAGVAVSAGFMAGVRARPPARCEPFMDQVRRAAAPGRGAATPTRPRPAPRAAWTTSTSPAPSSSPRCTPAAGPPTTSTPAASCPATPAPSSATATPATATSPTPCTPGAAHTCETCATCTPATPTASSGRGRWPTCSSDANAHGHRRPRRRARQPRPRRARHDPPPVPRRRRQGITDNQRKRRTGRPKTGCASRNGSATTRT